MLNFFIACGVIVSLSFTAFDVWNVKRFHWLHASIIAMNGVSITYLIFEALGWTGPIVAKLVELVQ